MRGDRDERDLGLDQLTEAWRVFKRDDFVTVSARPVGLSRIVEKIPSEILHGIPPGEPDALGEGPAR